VLTIANDVNIYAPNIFTPDGDDYNDNWRVYISGVEIYDFHLSIFNRWGELVFESFDSEATWDGTYGNNGQVVMSGNYVWTIDTKDLQNDNRYEFSGSILIMK
jgi:gliding motility-associated-like protein